jgi:hypothetical protein
MMKTNTSTTTTLRCHLPENSRNKIIGLGGIGCVVLQFMAIFLKSLGRPTRLVLIDGDRFEPANSQRMVFQTVGNKAEVKADETIEMLGQCDVSVVAVPEFVTVENAERLIVPGDYVLLCVDNHPTRKLVADRVGQLDNVALFSGGNEGVEPPKERGTYGNVQIHVRRDDKDMTVPITKYHPEIAHPKGKMPTDADCGQMALSTPQILFANVAVASAMLNAFFAFTCGQLGYQEAKLDILEARMLPQMLLKERI